ncbi:MAG: hypothetical protein KAI64_01685, partial [Thermoplasmata archaeon]|nr:hypothetical protein [Thermoplasmata archaeon]
EIERFLKEKDSLAQRIREIFKTSNIRPDPDTNLKKGMTEFRHAEQKYMRYTKLTDIAIPEVEKGLRTHEELAGLKREASALNSEITAIVREEGHLRETSPEREAASYARKREESSLLRDELKEKKAEIISRIGRSDEDYRNETTGCAALTNKIEILKEKKERAEHFRASVELAKDTLRDIAAEVYKEWSTVLNTEGKDLLQRLSPVYTDIRFDENLAFTVTVKEGSKRRHRDEIDHKLSIGAKDQIYLAVRLALGKYLTKGKESVPMVLDDAFSTSDDQRFLEAMRYLTDELSTKNQIILLTCHESRQELFDRTFPEIAAGRINRVKLLKR